MFWTFLTHCNILTYYQHTGDQHRVKVRSSPKFTFFNYWVIKKNGALRMGQKYNAVRHVNWCFQIFENLLTTKLSELQTGSNFITCNNSTFVHPNFNYTVTKYALKLKLEHWSCHILFVPCHIWKGVEKRQKRSLTSG